MIPRLANNSINDRLRLAFVPALAPVNLFNGERVVWETANGTWPLRYRSKFGWGHYHKSVSSGSWRYAFSEPQAVPYGYQSTIVLFIGKKASAGSALMTGGTNPAYVSVLTSGEFTVSINSVVRITSTLTMPDDGCIVAVTCDRAVTGDYNLYIDGVFDGNWNAIGYAIIQPQYFFQTPSWTNTHYADAAFWWNRILTPAEIRSFNERPWQVLSQDFAHAYFTPYKDVPQFSTRFSRCIPDGIIDASGFFGPNLSYIQDDPDDPDSRWMNS